MKRLMAAIAMGLGLTAAFSAQAEIWTCDYDGHWNTFGSSDRGKFNWSVVWQSKAGGGWTITGDYSDGYGQSVLNGNCGDRACSLTQVYKSGKLKGEKYFWKGKYVDEAAGNGRTVNRFEGKWGSSPNASDGAWHAVATCRRN